MLTINRPDTEPVTDTEPLTGGVVATTPTDNGHASFVLTSDGANLITYGHPTGTPAISRAVIRQELTREHLIEMLAFLQRAARDLGWGEEPAEAEA